MTDPGEPDGSLPAASVDELRLLAERLARDAGRLALDGRRRAAASLTHSTKSTATDPVTEFDRAAEQLIVDELRRCRPDDSIVGEEGTGIQGRSGLAWHVDPIDGTVNFVYDLAGWCTSIGVVDDHAGGVAVAGAVYVPVTDELFSAGRGRGATRNGGSIRCSSPDSLSTALVATGFSYSPERRAEQAQRLVALLPRVRDIRRSGSAAIDLCLVACGRLDGYFEEYLNSWDLVAGELICTEAGVVASDFAGGPPRPAEVVVAAPSVHAELVTAISESSPTH